MQNQAFYYIDTKGNNAVFSNDIAERKWDDKYHKHVILSPLGKPKYDEMANPTSDAAHLPKKLKGLSAGLWKKGDGELKLTGSTTYKGFSVVSGGTLNISKKEDGSGGEIKGGDVYVFSGGTLRGNGRIHYNLINQGGIVRPGNSDLSNLKAKSYTQIDGSLALDFDARGNSKLIANIMI